MPTLYLRPQVISLIYPGGGYDLGRIERFGKGLNKIYLYSQIKNGSLPMLTYIQDITAAETQREHRTPESPDGYFPDRCLKTLFFSSCGYSPASASSFRTEDARNKGAKARKPRASNRSLKKRKERSDEGDYFFLPPTLALKLPSKPGRAFFLPPLEGFLPLPLVPFSSRRLRRFSSRLF